MHTTENVKHMHGHAYYRKCQTHARSCRVQKMSNTCTVMHTTENVKHMHGHADYRKCQTHARSCRLENVKHMHGHADYRKVKHMHGLADDRKCNTHAREVPRPPILKVVLSVSPITLEHGNNKNERRQRNIRRRGKK